MSISARRAKRQAGFTLVELMIVVCIIITATALAAPAIGTAMADQRAGRAAQNLIRLGRHARAQSVAYGRAHVLRFSTASVPQGSMQLFRGITGTCNGNNWDAIMASPACGSADSMCIDELDLGESEYNGSTHTVTLTSQGPAAVDVCYQSNGAVLHRSATTGRFSDLNTVSGGFAFDVIRFVSGTQDGVTRTVVFPLGGVPRLLR